MSAATLGARLLVATLLAATPLAGAGHAQAASLSTGPDRVPPREAVSSPEMERRAARRFPQPVVVGTLAGRNLLEPLEAQPVLGRIAGVVRRGDGGVRIVVRIDGWLGLGRLGLSWLAWPGFGSRLVDLPVDAVALLGEHVALVELAPERFRALPTFEPGSAAEIPPRETVRVGLVRPFH